MTDPENPRPGLRAAGDTILRLAGELGATDFLVLDLLGAPARVVLVSVRAWASGGFVGQLLGEGLGEAALRWPQLQRCVLVGESTRGRPGAVPADPACGDARIFLVDDGGDLRDVFGERIRPEAVPNPGNTTITLFGKRVSAFRGRDLPLELSVRVPERAHPAHRVIRLEGNCGQAAPPRPTWVRLDPAPGGAATVLTVDAEASPGGPDRWRLSLAGGRATAVDRPPSVVGQRRLAVIFDRTCPDLGRWQEAKVLGQQGGIGYGEYNGEIRRGLLAGLQRALSPGDLVDVWWFADNGDTDLAVPQGVTLPPQPWANLGWHGSDTLDGVTPTLTYLPGLDVWEPLGEPVAGALEALDEDAPGWPGVLIVGNSPPRWQPGLPGQQDAFRKLAELRGVLTIARRANATWANAIGQAARLGIPMAYLFLSHEGGGGEPDGLASLLQVEGAVRAALEEQLPVVRRRASAQGVEEGVAAALDELQRLCLVTIDGRVQ